MNRLTARSTKNNIAYLVNVKPNEQTVESPYPNTLKCILDCFEKLAEYEETGFDPKQIKNLSSHIKEIEEENELLHEFRKITREAEKDTDTWHYMSGEDNHIDTLVNDVTVIISADDLRLLVKYGG